MVDTHRIHGAGIYPNIWVILMVNVTIYSIHGSYGVQINVNIGLTWRYCFSHLSRWVILVLTHVYSPKNGVWLALGTWHVKFDQYWALHSRGTKNSTSLLSFRPPKKLLNKSYDMCHPCLLFIHCTCHMSHHIPLRKIGTLPLLNTQQNIASIQSVRFPVVCFNGRKIRCFEKHNSYHLII